MLCRGGVPGDIRVGLFTCALNDLQMRLHRVVEPVMCCSKSVTSSVGMTHLCLANIPILDMRRALP